MKGSLSGEKGGGLAMRKKGIVGLENVLRPGKKDI